MVNVTFKKSWSPTTGPGFNPNEGAAFPLEQAIQIVALGFADFSNPDDAVANASAVLAATPTPLIGVDTFLETHADGSDPAVVLRQRGGR